MINFLVGFVLLLVCLKCMSSAFKILNQLSLSDLSQYRIKAERISFMSFMWFGFVIGLSLVLMLAHMIITQNFHNLIEIKTHDNSDLFIIGMVFFISTLVLSQVWRNKWLAMIVDENDHINIKKYKAYNAMFSISVISLSTVVSCNTMITYFFGRFALVVT